MQVLVISPRSELRPRGARGRSIFEFYQQITGIIDARLALDTQQASLLAEPSIDASKDQVVWLTNGRGKVSSWKELNENEQEALKSKLTARLENILDLINALANSNLRDDKEDADLLSVVMNYHTNTATNEKDISYPNNESIYSVGGEPVIINWGCDLNEGSNVGLRENVFKKKNKPAGKSALKEEVDSDFDAEHLNKAQLTGKPKPKKISAEEKVVLLDDTKHREGNHTSPVIQVEPKNSWVGWLLPLVILLLIILFGLRYCDGAIWSKSVQSESQANSVAQHDDENQLRREIQELEREIALRRHAECNTGLVPQTTDSQAQESEDMRCLEAGCEAGDIEVELSWNTIDDLDLYVATPSGETIYHGNEEVQNGKLDVDMNSGQADAVHRPVEHVRWLDGNAEPGLYGIKVRLYKYRSDQEVILFKVKLKQNGAVNVFNGRFSKNDEKAFSNITSFDIE